MTQIYEIRFQLLYFVRFYVFQNVPVFQNGRHDVNISSNSSKLKRAQLDLCETNFGKFHQNRPSSFAKRLWTDRQTDRQTHTQTLPVFFPETITIHLVNEMTKCKNLLALALVQKFSMNGNVLIVEIMFVMSQNLHVCIEYHFTLQMTSPVINITCCKPSTKRGPTIILNIQKHMLLDFG